MQNNEAWVLGSLNTDVRQITDLDKSPSERQLSRVVSRDLRCKQTPKVRTLVSPTCTNFESLFTRFLLARKCPGIHNPDYGRVWAGFLWVLGVWGKEPELFSLQSLFGIEVQYF